MTANIPNDPVAIQKLFTSRVNNADANTYVGEEQRLWYDPISNMFYVSDGVTPGGIPVGGGGGMPDSGDGGNAFSSILFSASLAGGNAFSA